MKYKHQTKSLTWPNLLTVYVDNWHSTSSQLPQQQILGADTLSMLMHHVLHSMLCPMPSIRLLLEWKQDLLCSGKYMGIDAHHLPPWSIFVLDLWKKNKRQNRYFKFSLSRFPPFYLWQLYTRYDPWLWKIELPLFIISIVVQDFLLPIRGSNGGSLKSAFMSQLRLSSNQSLFWTNGRFYVDKLLFYVQIHAKNDQLS